MSYGPTVRCAVERSTVRSARRERNAELGATLADKLFRVYLKDGTDVWLLIHIEVQAQPDGDFPRRMFVYHYRLLDRYNHEVLSIAILGDDRDTWRPSEFAQGRFGCNIRFQRSTVKLLDWRPRADGSALSQGIVEAQFEFRYARMSVQLVRAALGPIAPLVTAVPVRPKSARMISRPSVSAS